ncbi:hypothetical protein ZYGR_0AG05930 [Zygosaccharomyces rouxii]|uniref:Protein HID1 n=1 Tax=Zygosaccharomyces rouxii TaxID=4956 RepID=A0A1Q3AA62_ZYGRO|nr:hypothetical protein ZYGR_0AG05930 [Zygosaccharomyces rouxii]
MGNTDSKLSGLYRDHILQLAGVTIPLRDDNGDFSQFYRDFIASGNFTMEIFNQLVSPKELRYICKSNPANISSLVQFISLKIVEISKSLIENEDQGVPLTSPSSVSLLEIQLTDLLVCVRILTKVFPMHLSTGRENWLWTRDENGDVPGFLLLNSLLKLSFVEGFTLRCVSKPGRITHLLWENGVNTQDASYNAQIARIDSNRLEIVNLLLALCSADFYGLPNKFLTALCHLAPEYDVICLVASIVNTVCRYCNHSEESSMPYQNFSYKQSQQQQLPQLRFSLVSSCLQLLNLMCLRSDLKEAQVLARSMDPNSASMVNSNIALSYLATLNREFDLRLLLTSFAKIFKSPVNSAIDQESNLLSLPRKQSSSSLSNVDGTHRPNNVAVNTTSYANAGVQGTATTSTSTAASPTASSASRRSKDNESSGNSSGTTNLHPSPYGNSSSSPSLPPVSPLFLQSLIFLNVLVQNNKVFQNYVADKFGPKLIIFSIYYLQFYDNNVNQNGGWELGSTVIPLCYNLALFFSSKKLVLSKMLETFSPNYYANKLPNFFKLSSGNINHITYRDFSLIHLCNMAISDVRDNLQPRPWLFELIYNLLPIRANLRDEELVQLSSKKRPQTIGSGGISYNAAMALLHLLSKISGKTYLTTYASSPSGAPRGSYTCSPGYKLDCLALLLRVISIYVILYFEEAKNLTFALCRHQRILFQIKDSIDTISKNLNGPLQDLKVEDFFEHSFDLNLVDERSTTPSGDNKGESNAYSNQTLVFNNRGRSETADNRRTSGDNTNDESGTDDFSDDEDYELSRYASDSNIKKSVELLEYADLRINPIMSDAKVFNGMRPKWPAGITSKAKAKSSAKSDLSSSWVGSNSLSLLIRIARILLKQFPAISTISAKEYYQLLGKIAQFKEQFEITIKPYLPIFIYEFSEVQPLKLDLSPKNSIYQNWISMVCWTNVFNTHSGAYAIPQASNANSNANTNTNKSTDPNPSSANSNGVPLSRVSSADTLPSLEKFNSNGSMLSRTNSNSSSLMGYLSSYKNTDTSFSSPLEITNPASSTPKANSTRANNGNTSNSGSGTSFFRFAWNGFTKKDNNYAPIQEEATGPAGSPLGSTPSRPNPFILDTGLLKPNTWTGTKVKLFDVKTKEKEEFSLLDMTSSFLRRFRFNSVTSSGSTDNLNSAGGNSNVYNNNSNMKPNGVNQRPYKPRDSTLMLSTTRK